MEKVAKDFIAVNTECWNYFGVFPIIIIIVLKVLFPFYVYASKIFFMLCVGGGTSPFPHPPPCCRLTATWYSAPPIFLTLIRLCQYSDHNK